MQNIKNLKRYHPDYVDKNRYKLCLCIFLISEDGQDWHEC